MKKIKTAFASLVLLALGLSLSFSTLPRPISAHNGDSPKLTYPETN